MKNQLILIFIGIVYFFSCKPSEPNPSDLISFELEDNGKVVFTNSVNSQGIFNWYVEKEGYISSEKSPFFVFQSNGIKNIHVSWKLNDGLVKEEVFRVVVKNAQSPEDQGALNAVVYGKLIQEKWYPLYQNGLFFPNGSEFYGTIGNPQTLWKLGLDGLPVLLLDRNTKQSRNLSEFLSNISTGTQPLASFNNDQQILKPGFQVKVLLPNNTFSSGFSSKEKLEVLEIKEALLPKLYPGMEFNKTIWITWYYTNGEEGIKNLNFTAKNQYFFKE